MKKYYLLILLLPVLTTLLWIGNGSQILTIPFVDAARYADVARNLIENASYTSKYSFPGYLLKPGPWASVLPPSYILILSGMFKIFGISDLSVILTSSFFFIMLCLVVFELAKKLFNNNVAIISFLIISFDFIFLSSAKSGASEPFISFLIISVYLLVDSKKIIVKILVGFVVIVLFFSKLQSPIYLLGPLLYLALISKTKLKDLSIVLLPLAIIFLIVQMRIIKAIPSWGIYWPLFLQGSSLFPADNIPRATGSIDPLTVIINFKVILVKTFYNLYNLIKSANYISPLPAIASPLVLILGIIGFFNKDENPRTRFFKNSLVITFIVLIIMISAVVPHVRYLHPLVPLLIILASASIENFRKEIGGKRGLLFVSFVMFIFIWVQILGNVILDSRFKNNLYNLNKPSASFVIAHRAATGLTPKQTIVTNIDTWLTWYGNTNSVMIPIDGGSFKDLNGSLNADGIILSDFDKDNADHPLDGIWSDMFEDPQNIADPYINDTFVFDREVKIDSSEVYEKQNYKIVIHKRK